MYTLIELWAWNKPHQEICDRSASPWDDPHRRPSHADRRKALRRQCIDQEYSSLHADSRLTPKIRRLIRRLKQLAL